MAESDKKSGKILDGLKGLFTVTKVEKEGDKSKTPQTATSGTVKPSAVKPAASKAAGPAKSSPASGTITYSPEFAKTQSSKKQDEVLHSKTHQDLINAAYKAAEKLGIAPWVLLRAAGWGKFTEDRGKKYTGPIIDDIKGLDDAQKKALKEVLGL
jgi:hypothetical protein